MSNGLGQQAVAAALNVNKPVNIISTSNFSNNTLFATAKRGFSAKLQEVPAMGDSISEGVIESYVVPIGSAVKADDIIARIETDKVTVDILAAYDGVITKWHHEEGDTVPVGAPFVDIDSEASASAAAPVEAKQEAAAPVKAAEPVKEAPKAATPAPPKVVTPAPQKVASNSANMTTVISKKPPSEIGG